MFPSVSSLLPFDEAALSLSRLNPGRFKWLLLKVYVGFRGLGFRGLGY